MTVRELIEKLERFEKDLPVSIEFDGHTREVWQVYLDDKYYDDKETGTVCFNHGIYLSD